MPDTVEGVVSDRGFVTGVGIVCPAGADTPSAWQTMLAGIPCVTPFQGASITGGAAVCVGRVPDFSPEAAGLNGNIEGDRVCQLALAAADQAWAAAGLHGVAANHFDPARSAVSFGTSKGSIFAFSSFFDRFLNAQSTRKNAEGAKFSRRNQAADHPVGAVLLKNYQSPSISYFDPYSQKIDSSLGQLSIQSDDHLIVQSDDQILKKLLRDVPPDAAARMLAARYGITGGTHASVAACATGSLAVIRAVQMIRDGQADVVIAGSADASLHPLWLAAFEQMKALAKPHPQRGSGWACRPFDRDRCGFAMAEGAAALIIESEASVRRRGIEPLARISGYAMGSDSTGLATVHQDGAPLAELIKIAACRAGIELGMNPRKHGSNRRIVAVQAHGTGTFTNDLAEMNALRACHLCSDQIPIVSFKGALGHMLGAAGAVELAISALAIKHRILPGNATLLEPDPTFAPTWLPTKAIGLEPKGAILKTSLGFGGHLAALVLESP